MVEPPTLTRQPDKLSLLGIALTAFGVYLAYRQTEIAKEQTRIAQEQTLIGKQQANLGEEQLRLTKEQMRTKTKDVRITAHLSQAKFERDGRKLRMVHFHLVNVGEVTINRGDFLVGPYLDFERPVVDECSFSAVRPGSLRAECNVKHKQYVEIKIPVDFRTDDFISFNVTFIDEPGPITCTYRIKDGEARTSDVQIELFGDLIAVPAAPL